jgi:hypothetical protein
MLQDKSKSVDADFGTLCMARSLYASQQQGKPAYPHRYLLYIVADYFDTDVVLFTLDGEATTSQELDPRSLHFCFSPLPPHTASPKAVYTYTVYGRRDPSREHAHPQILLVTNASKTHYGPVDFDTTPLHLTSGWTTSFSSSTPPPSPPPTFQTTTTNLTNATAE